MFERLDVCAHVDVGGRGPDHPSFGDSRRPLLPQRTGWQARDRDRSMDRWFDAHVHACVCGPVIHPSIHPTIRPIMCTWAWRSRQLSSCALPAAREPSPSCPLLLFPNPNPNRSISLTSWDYPGGLHVIVSSNQNPADSPPRPPHSPHHTPGPSAAASRPATAAAASRRPRPPDLLHRSGSLGWKLRLSLG